MELPERAVTLDDVVAAADRISAFVHRTPLVESSTLNRMTNTRLGLKAENLQRTGSFKSRGAVNALLQLTPEQRVRGVVTMSAGNHGQGLAYAAGLVGVRCVVFMPEQAVPTKVAAVMGYGAEARFAPTMETLFSAMEDYRQNFGLHYVHPFADPDIIAGQGTVALEILEDCPETETIVVPVGGGGLISGVAVVAKSIKPSIRVIGVEPKGAAAVRLSLDAGRPITLERIETVADGLAAPFAESLPLRLIERYVDDVLLLDDEHIVAALRLILERAKLLVEPAGAAAFAALLSGTVQVPQDSQAIAILSGGNTDLGKLQRLL